jgi:hypothetical protein
MLKNTIAWLEAQDAGGPWLGIDWQAAKGRSADKACLSEVIAGSLGKQKTRPD